LFARCCTCNDSTCHVFIPHWSLCPRKPLITIGLLSSHLTSHYTGKHWL
jgi:hypothetical protein